MGNYRFKLSDMIPNAWFYKLREMGSGRKQATTSSRKKKQSLSPKPNRHQQCNPRKSYYFTRELHQNNNNSPQVEPPRKPSKQKTRRRISAQPAGNGGGKTSSSSVSAGCSYRTTLDSVWTKEGHSSSPLDSFSSESESPPDPEFRTDRVLIPTESSSFDEMVSSCACRNSNTTTTTDVVVIDVDKNSLPRKDDKLQRYEYVGESVKPHNQPQQSNYREPIRDFSELQLPPIITKPNFLKEQKQQQQRKSGLTSPGVKLRVNSPRIASRKVQSHGRRSVSKTASSGNRKSLSDSLAIVKSSFNPQKDFRESMVEMIVENNIRASKDLEDLLACYLSLNSDQYHDLIIKVFKQIWFDFTQTS